MWSREIKLVRIRSFPSSSFSIPFFLFVLVTPKPPKKSEKDKGMSTGVIAAIIIVIIIIILLVVDMFCCFFNHCGFTHCCFETFCSSSQNKYAPTDAKEPDEKQELKS